MAGKRVAQLRRIKSKRGLSYNRMGDEIGVTGMTVYRWFKNRLLPRNRLVIRAVDEFLARNQAYLGKPVTGPAQPTKKVVLMDAPREVVEV